MRAKWLCRAGQTALALAGLALVLVPNGMRFTGYFLLGILAVWYCGLYLRRWGKKSRTGKVCFRVFLAGLSLGAVCLVCIEAAIVFRGETDNSAIPVDAVIVLGAGVNGTVPSLSLQVRLEAALAYVQDKPDIPIIVSGSRGQGEDISEARCMADWLIGRGIEPERIWLEEQADNTQENIGYSLAMLAERGMDPAAAIAVVTSDYHLCRASMYMTGNMVPVAAALPVRYLPLTANYYIREAFGVAEAIVFR